MSLAPSPCTSPFAIRPGRLPCAGHGVVVRHQDDQREALPPGREEHERLVSRVLCDPFRRNETEHVLPNRRLVAALGGNVHELERPRGEAVGERGHRQERTAA